MFSKVKAVLNFLKSGCAFQAHSRTSNGQININLKPIKELNAIDQRRTTKNEEDITIIWLTNNLKNLYDQSLIASLQSINDYMQVNKFNDI